MMENIYWLGYKIAIVLETLSIIIGFTYLSSIRAKNLGKVGLYYSIYQGKFVEGKKPGIVSKIVGIVLTLAINPFFSWIEVLWRMYAYINLLISKLSTPEKIKEIQYKLGTTILTKEEVKELIQESAHFLGKNIEFNTEHANSEEEHRLILEDGGRYRDMELYEDKIYINSHPADYLSNFNSIYEYKIEGTKVYQRLLEDSTEHAGSEEYYNVKDGIVLESEIIKRYDKNKDSMLIIMGDAKEQIEEIQKRCQWNEINSGIAKYFILAKNSKIISELELKKYFRGELEKTKSILSQFKNLFNKYDVELKYNKEERIYTRNHNHKNNKQISLELKKILKEKKYERNDIERSEENIEALNEYLKNLSR